MRLFHQWLPLPLTVSLFAILQKMGVLFRLHVVDGLAGMRYLPNDVDLPLYMPTVDR